MGNAGEEVLRFGFHRMGAESWGEVGGAPNMDAPPSLLLTCRGLLWVSDSPGQQQ